MGKKPVEENHRIRGGCLCEKVAYEVAAEFRFLLFCHCDQCRKITGSAHASNLFGNPAGFRWLKGEEYIKRYDMPGRYFSKAFCRDCGSGVPYLISDGKVILVPAGSLDGEPVFPKKSKVFYREHTAWCVMDENTPVFDGYPDYFS